MILDIAYSSTLLFFFLSLHPIDLPPSITSSVPVT